MSYFPLDSGNKYKEVKRLHTVMNLKKKHEVKKDMRY